jgi:hypothetical protein
MPSIPTSGTKSRVETQIRLVFDLASAEPFVEGADYNRVGSWKWIKLPKGTSTKKRARKAAKIGRLFPHRLADRVLIGFQNRRLTMFLHYLSKSLVHLLRSRRCSAVRHARRERWRPFMRHAAVLLKCHVTGQTPGSQDCRTSATAPLRF